MSLLRIVARSMLASYFVVNGAKAVVRPQPLVADAEPVAHAILPAVKRIAPAQLAGRIPEDTATLVRMNGAVQALGGLALASGYGRRLGALTLAGTLVPATLARHAFWKRTDPAQKAADRSALLKNIALLGGLVIAGIDTEGRPSLTWRARRGRRQAGAKVSARVEQGRRAVRRQAKQARRDGRSAVRAAAHGVGDAARTASSEARLAAKDLQLKLS